MAEQQQEVYGAGLLSSVIALLFGGLGKALSDAAEYQEEMGVLKQINTINIHAKDGKVYTLTVKLAPVRDKDGVFYVETSTTAPNLDVESMNDIVLKLDNSNIKDFKKKITEFLEKKGYYMEENSNADEDSAEQSNSDEESEQSEEDKAKEGDKTEEDNQSESEIGALLEEAREYYEQDQLFTSKPGLGLVYLKLDFSLSPNDDSTCLLEITGEGVEDTAGKIVVDTQEYELDTKDELGNVLDFNHFNGNIMQAVQDYLSANGLSKNLGHGKVNSSTLAKVCFTKNNKEVTLKAVEASTNLKPENIEATIDLINDLAENEEFISELEDNKDNVFVIVDEGDDYDVERVDDTISKESALLVFDEVSDLLALMQSYQWAVGIDNWVKDTMLEATQVPTRMLQTRFALYIKDTLGIVPIPTAKSGSINLNDSEELTISAVSEAIQSKLWWLSNFLELHYTNFDELMQKGIDEFIDTIEDILNAE